MSTRVGPALSATQYKIGDQLTVDGVIWKVIPSGKSQRWSRIKSALTCSTAEAYYDQLNDSPPPKALYVRNYQKFVTKFELLKKELAARDIIALRLGFKDIANYSDFAWETAQNKILSSSIAVKQEITKRTKLFERLSFLFYTDNNRFWALRNGELHLQHNVRRKDKAVIVAALEKYFGSKFQWNGKATSAITLKID